jgi:hypothetical protein
MKRILEFLELNWNSSVLHHEMFIGKDISLSKLFSNIIPLPISFVF